MVDLDDYGGDERHMDMVLDIRRKCKAIMEYFLDYKGSIRQCTEWTGIPKSTVWYYIQEYISYYWDEEYVIIKNILRRNKRERFKPRNRW